MDEAPPLFPASVVRSVITPFCQRNGRVPAYPTTWPAIVDAVGVSALNRAKGPEVRHHVGTRRSGGSLPVPGERGNEDHGEGRR